MTKELGVGDVGILWRVLLVPQLKTDLMSEYRLAREMGWAVNAKNLWKRVINDDGELPIEGLILDESNLYVVDPACFPDNSEEPHVEVGDEIESTTGFANMADIAEERLSRLNWESFIACTVDQFGQMGSRLQWCEGWLKMIRLTPLILTKRRRHRN